MLHRRTALFLALAFVFLQLPRTGFASTKTPGHLFRDIFYTGLLPPELLASRDLDALFWSVSKGEFAFFLIKTKRSDVPRMTKDELEKMEIAFRSEGAPAEKIAVAIQRELKGRLIFKPRDLKSTVNLAIAGISLGELLGQLRDYGQAEVTELPKPSRLRKK